MLAGYTASVSLSLPPATHGGQFWPQHCRAHVRLATTGRLLANVSINPYLSGNASEDGLMIRDDLDIPVIMPSGITAESVGISVALFDESEASPPLWASSKPTTAWVLAPVLSILPPIATVGFALVLRQVIVALALGCWVGATLAFSGLNPIIGGLRVVDTLMPQAMWGGNAEILVFTILLGGLIALVRASGGAAGLAAIATRCTHKPEHVLIAAAVLGVAVGLDDYGSLLISGSAMQPIAAALGVHPLRLAWCLHGVAVCAPSIHPLSSWFGVQLALVAGALATLPGAPEDASPLLLLLATTPYRLCMLPARTLVSP